MGTGGCPLSTSSCRCASARQLECSLATGESTKARRDPRGFRARVRRRVESDSTIIATLAWIPLLHCRVRHYTGTGGCRLSTSSCRCASARRLECSLASEETTKPRWGLRGFRALAGHRVEKDSTIISTLAWIPLTHCRLRHYRPTYLV